MFPHIQVTFYAWSVLLLHVLYIQNPNDRFFITCMLHIQVVCVQFSGVRHVHMRFQPKLNVKPERSASAGTTLNLSVYRTRLIRRSSVCVVSPKL